MLPLSHSQTGLMRRRRRFPVAVTCVQVLVWVKKNTDKNQPVSAAAADQIQASGRDNGFIPFWKIPAEEDTTGSQREASASCRFKSVVLFMCRRLFVSIRNKYSHRQQSWTFRRCHLDKFVFSFSLRFIHCFL